MREGWKEILLSDHCYFINGGSWSDKEYVEAGIPVIKVTNMVEGRISFNSLDHLPESSRKKYEKHLLKKGDLVVATVGSHPTQPNSVVGRTSIIPTQGDNHLLNQNAVCVRVFNDDMGLHPLFLFYLTQTTHFKHYAATRAKGSANQVRLAISELKKYTFPAPPLPLQTRIADLLSAYDELIELNNRRIALLEQTAEQLYKEWFVRLRFPGYTQTKVRKGVPEGWSVKRLGDYASNPRRSVKKEHLSEKDIYIGLEHLPVKSLTLRNWTTADTVNSNKLKFKKGEILFSKIRPYLHKVAVAPFDGICSTDTIILKTEAEKFKYYIPLLVNSTTFIDFASLTSKGTKMPRADWYVLKEFNLFDPTTDVIEKFNHQLKPIFKTCDQLNRHNQTLRRTRDLLLPRLISGQLSVAKAETALNA